jgi:DNA adenine methylase
VDFPLKNDSETYYTYRDRFNQLLADYGARSQEAAALFYYLNRTGYNGLCRFNQQGFFNVPFGRYTTINYTYDFSLYQEVLRHWRFSHGDFQNLKLDPDDFVYADPPYDVEFTQYAKEGFAWDDQVRLAEWLAAHPGPVVLSNQATPRIVKLYKDLGFTLHYLSAPRMISCTGDRTPAREVLAVNHI